MAGEEVGKMKLNDAIFAVEINDGAKTAMHQAVVLHLANQRQGTQSAKTRAEVSGGGRKPWRQKGTGHARQGSTRSPQWRKGGVVFAPKPRDYGFKMNKKLKALAVKAAFTTKFSLKDLIIIDSIKFDEYKTKPVAEFLTAVKAKNKPLIVLGEKNDIATKSARNIPNSKIAVIGGFGVYDILNHNSIVIEKAAVEKLQEVYA